MTVGQRLRDIQKSNGLRNVDMAKIMGITPQNISNLYRGDYDPRLQGLIAVLKHFENISPSWLIMGDGDMLRSTKSVEQQLREDLSHCKDIVDQQKAVIASQKLNIKLLQDVNGQKPS